MADKDLDLKRVHEFALKYLDLYENLGTDHDVKRDKPVNLESIEFANECRELGFEMDCFESLRKEYPYVYRVEELERIAPEITDVRILGNGIFSKWRDATRGYMSSPLHPEIRPWFVIAFRRLAELTEGATH